MSIYGCVLGLAGLCIFGALLNGNTHFIPYILLGGAVLLLVVYILERISPTPPPSDPTPPYQPPKPPSVKDATRNSEPADFTQKPYTPPSPMDFTIRVANAKSGIQEEIVDVRRAPVSEVTEASASHVFSAPEQRVRNEDFEIKNRALIKYKGNESHVTVPDGVERICTYAFTEIEKFMVWVSRPGDEGVVTHEIERPMDYVREVVLPDSVSYIEGRAFAWCENLESVRFGKNIRVIEKGAFHKCIHLEKVVFGEKLAGIGWAAFQGCTSLKKVKVPEETTIEDGAFEKTTEIVRVPKNQSASNDASRTASSAKKCKSLTLDEFERIRSISEDQKKQIEVISINGDNADRMTNLSKLFYKFHGVKKIDISHVDTSFATSMYLMFYECRKLEELNMTGMNTSGVVNMQGVFLMCESLVKLDLSSFDTSHVREMGYMFTSCRNLRDLNLSGFDTSAAENMTCMFSGCAMLNPIDVSRFNTANVTDMSCMFNGCKSLLKLDLTGFDTSKVRSMARMFDSCQSLTELDLSSFNTGNVESMKEMFKNCASLVQLNLSGFDFSNVKDMKNMFSGCVSLKTVVLSDTVLKGRTERKTGRVITRTVPRSEEEMEPVYAYGAQSRSQVYAYSDPYKTVTEEEVKTVSLGELSEKEIIESLGLNGDVRLTIVKHQAPASENR